MPHATPQVIGLRQRPGGGLYLGPQHVFGSKSFLDENMLSWDREEEREVDFGTAMGGLQTVRVLVLDGPPATFWVRAEDLPR